MYLIKAGKSEFRKINAVHCPSRTIEVEEYGFYDSLNMNIDSESLLYFVSSSLQL